MHHALDRLATGIVVAGVFALGLWLGSARTVTAAPQQATTKGNPLFQMGQVDNKSALIVYEPTTHSVYVYQGVTVGSNNLSCSYRFQMDSPGGMIQRLPCQ